MRSIRLPVVADAPLALTRAHALPSLLRARTSAQEARGAPADCMRPLRRELQAYEIGRTLLLGSLPTTCTSREREMTRKCARKTMPDRDPVLRRAVKKIRRLKKSAASHGKLFLADIIKIGKELSAIKDRVGHGNWLPWLRQHFDW